MNAAIRQVIILGKIKIQLDTTTIWKGLNYRNVLVR